MQKAENKHEKRAARSWAGVIVSMIVALLGTFISLQLPQYIHLLEVGAGFAARTVCSGLWVSHRPLHSMEEYELQGIAGLFSVTVDKANSRTTASFLGLGFRPKHAVYISPVLGCRLLDSQDIKGSEKLAARHKTATLGSGDDGDDGGASKIADLELIHAPNLGLTHWLDSQFSANAHTANHTRAIIVVHKGVIVGERYSSFLESTADSADSAAAASPAGTASTAETHRKPSLPKIDKNTKLLGWSMMKSIHALLIGAAEHQGMLGPLGINRPVALVDFSKAEKEELYQLNGGKEVTFGDLIRMVDILKIEENYAIHKDVPKMLYLSSDFAKHCSNPVHYTRRVNTEFSFPKDSGSGNGSGSGGSLAYDFQQLWARVRGDVPTMSTILSTGASASASASSSRSSNTKESKGEEEHVSLGWYYSSGLTNVLAKEFRSLFSSDEEYYTFPHKYLFHPLGISSFTIETDSVGTFVGSSYGYGTARDWAKLGLLLVNKGRARSSSNSQILSEEFVKWVLMAHPHSGGLYGGSVWLNPAAVSVARYNDIPLNSPNKLRYRWITQVLPPDAFGYNGFMGQMVVGVPSLELVVVRIGFTEDNDLTSGDLEQEGKVRFNRASFFRQILEHVASA